MGPLPSGSFASGRPPARYQHVEGLRATERQWLVGKRRAALNTETIDSCRLIVSGSSLVQSHEMESASQIEDALDERHAAASAAFAQRDITAYQALFSSDLQYTQHDGITIDRSRLMQHVATQFARLNHAESDFVREALEIENGQVTETLLQIATVRASAFGFLWRTWRVERHGLYTWAVEDGEWRIVRVRVLSETVAGRWKLGR